MNKNYNLIKILNKKKYKYGFKSSIKNRYFPLGINKIIIKKISENKQEPIFLFDFRIKAYNFWKNINIFPIWSNLNISKINYTKIKYQSTPNFNLNKMDLNLVKIFDKLGIKLKEKNNNNLNLSTDAVFNSLSIKVTYKEKLSKKGIIFCSISDAIKFYPYLIKKFLGSVISFNDNFFSLLNSAIFSDGSFCYIPKNTNCPLELSTYFRINDNLSGQFERTLIIAEKNSSINYLESCTASKYNKIQLHCAIVELILFENSEIKYSTIQNWYHNENKKNSGIYNFVTKRALAFGKNSRISWVQVETGSAITWKYPSCVLLGKNSSGEFYSITLTNNFQQVDTGTKMIHLGEKTKSKIIAKGISCGISKNSYRGLVKINSNAIFARNFSQCDSFLLSNNALVSTYPYIDNFSFNTILEHEATISKINEDQILYLMQRGLNFEQSIHLIMNGFCKEVLNHLPLEFIQEANKLLNLHLNNN